MMKKLIKSFGFAFQGIAYAIKTQVNFRIHLVATLIAISLGFYVDLDLQEWLWIAFCIGIVLIMELINTALEVFVDLVSPEYNIKAGIIKDVSAGAVLITALLAVIIGGFIFIPKLL